MEQARDQEDLAVDLRLLSGGEPIRRQEDAQTVALHRPAGLAGDLAQPRQGRTLGLRADQVLGRGHDLLRRGPSSRGPVVAVVRISAPTGAPATCRNADRPDPPRLSASLGPVSPRNAATAGNGRRNTVISLTRPSSSRCSRSTPSSVFPPSSAVKWRTWGSPGISSR